MQRTEPHFVVKICGITRAEDASAAISAGANAIGFNFYKKSPRYITPDQARGIAVAGEYLRVGVFVNARAAEIAQIAAMANLDVLQLHGEQYEIPDGAWRVWRAVAGENPAPATDERIEAYLLDAATPAYGGSGQTFDWSRAASFPHRIIAAGGLDASNVREAIAVLHPWGVDACSRLEEAPGKKHAGRMQAFIAAALESTMVKL